MTYHFKLIPTNRSIGYMIEPDSVRLARFLTPQEAKFERSFMSVQVAETKAVQEAEE